MAASLPRVAIAIPSGNMVHAAFSLAFAELCRDSRALRIDLISVRSSIVAIARNNGVDIAQGFGADYLFFLDSDMVFPPTILLRLLSHRKDIVGATYVKRVPPFDLLGSRAAEAANEASPGLIEMHHMPTGCLLIHMSVFDSLAKPYFRFGADDASGEVLGEDYMFCDRARDAGFRIWCEPALSAEVGHIGQRIYRLNDAPKAAGSIGPPSTLSHDTHGNRTAEP